jgi:hypothetical protein
MKENQATYRDRADKPGFQCESCFSLDDFWFFKCTITSAMSPQLIDQMKQGFGFPLVVFEYPKNGIYLLTEI